MSNESEINNTTSTNPVEDSSQYTDVVNEIGYPVHVSFIELAKLYMNTVPWQWHPEIEVIIVNHGDILFMTNEEKRILHAGEGVIINANVMHSIMPATENINCSMYSTIFHPTFLFGYGDIMMSNKYLSPITANHNFQFLQISDEDNDTASLSEHINTVIALNMIKGFGFELKTKAELCVFWLELINIITPNETASAKKVHKSTSLDEARTKEIILYMEEHYAEKITLDELADQVHISKSECCRCFKRVLNVTPIEYLMRFRITTAAMMIQKEYPIARSFSELAYHVGFNNASYFNKIFKEFIGCTPSEFKKKTKTDPNFDPFRNIII